MSQIREFGIRSRRGAVLVIDEEQTDRTGDSVPIVSLDYDLDREVVSWQRNRRAPQRDDVRWEETDWSGAQDELRARGFEVEEIAGVRDRYRDLFAHLASKGAVDASCLSRL